jgi:predicted small metal-binding protein
MEMKCRDVGFECDYVVKGNTEQEIMQNAVVHAQKDHGMKPQDMTDDLKNKIRANIPRRPFEFCLLAIRKPN